MANGEGAIVDGVIADAKAAKAADGCMAHGPMLTAVQATSTALQHTNKTLEEVRNITESTQAIVTGIDAKFDAKLASSRKIDPKDAATWIRLIGAAGVTILLILQMFRSGSDAKQDKALDILMRLQGVDVTQLDSTAATLKLEDEKGKP